MNHMKSLLLKNVFVCLIVLLSHHALATIYYVSTTGNDSTGNGSATSPWRTLMYAAAHVPASQGHTIQVSAGTFIENGLVEIPLGVNVIGAGKDVTILKAASSFYYHPADPGYATDKFLISLSQVNPSPGNQTLQNFTIDGDSKQLHGGIYVRYRNNVVIDGVSVKNTNFTGIWLWDVQSSQITNTQLLNCSWGSTGYCSGALNLGNLTNVEISNLNVDENTGYGVKAIGPDGYNDIFSLKIHDSHISVAPYGLWNNGSAPNIALELWSVNLVTCEIYNTYVDNTISLVNSQNIPSSGTQTMHLHDNTLDMVTRSSGSGYGLELTINDAEVDHNYFIQGSYGIANWDNPMQNWNIHNNVFYGIQGTYPGEIVRSQWSGLHNVKLYNNTIEFIGAQTSNVVGVYGGASDNLDIKNNLVINNNTSYSFYPNQVIHSEGGATISNLTVLNNSTTNMDPGDLLTSLLSALNPLVKLTPLANPSITKSGNRPAPYYIPASGSSLIDAGLNVGLPYTGTAPDIGAYEFGGTTNAPPQVNITSPTSNASFTSGSSITITANATDTNGTISKVEFFQGSTKLGEVLASPYAFTWTNVPQGTYSLTAKATDNLGATTTSPGVTITVTNPNLPPTVSITSPVNNASFTAGSSITINASATDSDGTVSKVEFFQGTTKLGEVLTSPYSFVWTSVPAGSYSLTSKATDNLGLATTSTAIAITVTSTNAPTVSITSPVNNASFTSGKTITIAATAKATNGTISKVEFYQGATKLGQDTTSPYSFAWAKAPSGNYSLAVKATDSHGVSTTSSSVSITVDNPPVVSIVSPATNSSFVAGTWITINANATDSDGTIAKVEFFQGTTKLGEDLTSPYSFVWTGASAGRYTLTTKATDNLSVITTSAAIAITVTTPNMPPAVLITTPVNNSTFTTSSTVTITANATDSDGTISKVEFFQGTTKLGEALTSPYSYAWSSIIAGNYSLTAKATDNAGASTISSAIAITITDPNASSIKLGLYAPDATLSGGMALTADPTTSKGSYFSVPSGYGTNYYIPPTATAIFNFQLSKTDNYVMWARIKSADVNHQGYYVYDGNGRWITWEAGVHTDWTWVQVTDANTGAAASFSFAQGLNEIQMAWYQDNVPLDEILITNDPTFVPTDVNAGSDVVVFPNPIVDNFTIQYTSPVAQQAQVSIFDSSGVLVQQTMVSLTVGLNNIAMNTNNIYNGIYYLKFASATGDNTTVRVVVSR
jgi:hypothetical protein